MGFCYPGVLPNGGDAPPRPECAPLWHDQLLAHLPHVELVVLAGMYAQARYPGKSRKRTLTATVAGWGNHGPHHAPHTHPSRPSLTTTGPASSAQRGGPDSSVRVRAALLKQT